MDRRHYYDGLGTSHPGFRLDYFGSTEDFIYQPRFSTRWQMAKSTTLKGVSVYMLNHPGDEATPGLGNVNVNPERSWQASLGMEQRLSDTLDLDVAGYYKGFDDLIGRNDDPGVRVDNRGLDAHTVSKFCCVTTRQPIFWLDRLHTAASERRDEPGEPWRLFDSDQTHNIIVVAQYRVTPRWRLGRDGAM